MNFRIISSLVTFVFGLIVVSTSAQNLPDYPGRNYFFYPDSASETGQSVSLQTATEGFIIPEQYFVGPGDKLFIYIRGVVEAQYPLVINQEGGLLIPTVGMIDLKNLTLADSKQKIKSEIFRYYKDVDVQINLVDFRKIKVSIIGNVKIPASLTVSSNTRLMDLLVSFGSVLASTDLRNINIISNNGQKSSYDLLSFLRLGEKENNPYLREGDIVQIMVVDQMVHILGSVIYPGTYEFRSNDSAGHLLNIAGGFTEKAYPDSIELISFDADNKFLHSSYYSYSDFIKSDVRLKSGDKIIVREKPDFMIDRLVKVSGYVKYPGYYKILKNKTTLKEIILNEAGGFLENASLKNASVIRTAGEEKIDPEFERLKTIPRADMTDDEYDYFKTRSRERKGRMVVDFEKLFLSNDENENLILKRDDEIIIPEVVDYISVLGQVVNPGHIIYKADLSVEDYIKLAGGFAWRAVESDIRLVKRNTGEWIDEDDVTEIEPGDIIWVPEETPPPKFWETFTDILIVVGQVATVITAVVAIIVASRK